MDGPDFTNTKDDRNIILYRISSTLSKKKKKKNESSEPRRVMPGERYQEKMCVIISNENEHDAVTGGKKTRL